MPTRPPVFRPLGRTREQQTAALRKDTDNRRGSSAARGYGADWQRLRAAYLQQHPLCVECQAAGQVTAATVVDHVVAIADAPSRRLDESNLRSLCKPHHDARTARDQGFGRARAARQGGGGSKV